MLSATVFGCSMTIGARVEAMTRPGLTCTALLALCAVVATVTPAAQATSAPFWSINGTRLAAGQTHNISGRAAAPFVLATAAVGSKIECKKLKLKEAVLLGSNENNPGTNNEVIVFEECAVLEGNGHPNCKLTATSLTTNSLKSEVVERAESPKILLTEFFPAKGLAFMTLRFEGSECKVKETVVDGDVAAEDTTDTLSEECVEAGQAPKEATSWDFRFPETPIKKIILVKEGVATEKTLETLEAFSDPSVQTGTALVLLANSKFESEEKNWSPLP